jgi:hypothetical protein
MVAAPTTKSALSGIHTHANHKWQRSKSLSLVEAIFGGFGMMQRSPHDSGYVHNDGGIQYIL